MTPALARRGKLVLASAVSFVLVGALNGAAPLIALGGVVITALLAAYLWFFPAAILLRRRKVELSWWMPPGDLPGGALSVDRPLPLHIALRNHGARRLRVLGVDVLATSALETPQGLEAVVRSGKQVEVVGYVHARQAGYHVLHGATLRFGDILGLFSLAAYFPNSLPLKVFPRESVAKTVSHQRVDGRTLHERQGMHQVRRRGLAGELRELREHSHGDPFKNIAWKATAKHRKLMVRDLETEIVLTHQFVLDIGGSMRHGGPGNTKLDYAIELVTGLAKVAIDNGDRAGMVTFDSRVYSHLSAGDGHQHYLKLIDRLLETHNVVDEDLTDLTNSELVAAVARYLAHQEAVDVRLREAPSLDDPAWERIQAGPGGELYDIEALGRILSALLKTMGQAANRPGTAPAWWWNRVQIAKDSAAHMAKLRLFCRLRGIELPYQCDHEFGRRALGFREALEAVHGSKSRADTVVMITDLEGLFEDVEFGIKALMRGRRAGKHLVTIVPFAPDFGPEVATRSGSLVAETLRAEEQLRIDRARRILADHGVSLLVVGPGDHTMSVLARLQRARSSARGKNRSSLLAG